MKRRRIAVALLVMLPVAGLTQAVPDTSDWQCETCPFPEGVTLDLETGAAYVSDDAFRFGDRSGFDDDGAFVVGGFDLDYWLTSESYWRAAGRNLGLDTRSVDLEGGRAGTWAMRLSYAALPRQLFDTTMTPYSGLGGERLRLPGGWTATGSSATMPDLAASLRPFEVAHDRERTGLGFSFIPTTKTELAVDYRHERREGLDIFGGSFVSLASLLPAPVDYTTDQLDASATWADGGSQLAVNYFASSFDSDPHSLTWDSAFTPLAPGATQGRAATPPDNQAHKLSVSGATQLGFGTRIAATAAIGQMRQDDAFLPATINALLDTAPLPRSALDGEVNTTHFNLRLTLRPMQALRVRAGIDYDDRDNDTPRDDYEIVQTDLFLDGLRRNVPYSFERTRLHAEARYRLTDELTVSGGVRQRKVKRDFQEVDRTDDDLGWFGLRVNGWRAVDHAMIKVGQDARHGSDYRLPDDPSTGQNPLLRLYNLAERDRDFVEASVVLVPTDRIDIGLSGEMADEDYFDSTLGLTASEYRRVGIDGSLQLGVGSLLSVFWDREIFESSQAGSGAFAAPDWTADAEDEIDTVGFSLRLPALAERVDLGLEYVLNDADGETAIRTAGNPLQSFPVLEARLRSARIYADFRPNERYTVRAAWYHERLETSDWALDGFDVDTVPSLLSVAPASPNYSVGVFQVSFRYALQR